MSVLDQVFALVCGQEPSHSWMPGGDALPFCQRCTGLYTGAAIAAALQLILRLRPRSAYLWFHGLLLLQMVPFGFHLVPQGPVLRTLSGQLFSLGVVAYLWLVPGSRLAMGTGEKPEPWKVWLYGLSAGAGSFFVLVGAAWGGPVAAAIISWIGLAGLAALVVLTLANLALLLTSAWAWARHARQSVMP
ncbi:MAG: DUF2085 domain-containing protein [Chloroflexi bacterium]|nr:DUF2085 domain-containing protein [Chloroflexota bacterium]